MDEDSWLQRFGPRRPRGGWSRLNTRHVERLIAAGRMKPAGLAEVNAARQDGKRDLIKCLDTRVSLGKRLEAHAWRQVSQGALRRFMFALE